jgi:hypothetical protein
VEVILRDPGDDRSATVATEAGELRGPDLLVTIALADADSDLEDEIGA